MDYALVHLHRGALCPVVGRKWVDTKRMRIANKKKDKAARGRNPRRAAIERRSESDDQRSATLSRDSPCPL